MSKQSVKIFCNEVNKTVLATYNTTKSGTPSKILAAFFSSCNYAGKGNCKYYKVGGKDWDNDCPAFRSASLLVNG